MYKLITTFTDRYPLVGPSIWLLCIEYFFAQYIVAEAWVHTYSLGQNTISDLGATTCGIYSNRYTCSPLHALMNASFIALGIFMSAGAVLIYREFRENTQAKVGFTLMGIAGTGPILVGLFPENSIGWLHELGAGLPFLVGNIALVILGLALDIPKPLRFYTVLSGSLSLVALAILVSHHYLGLGIGGIERLTAYPQTVWLIIFGIYMSRNHFRKKL